MAVLGLILGIVGLVGGIICPFVFPLIGAGEFVFVVLAVAGIVFSAIGMKRKKGAAVAGLVLSIIGVVISVIFAFACTMGRQAADAVTNEIGAGVVNEIAGQLETLDADKLMGEVESAFAELGDALSQAVGEVETTK